MISALFAIGVAGACVAGGISLFLRSDFVYRLYPAKTGDRHIHTSEKPRIGGLVIIPVFVLTVSLMSLWGTFQLSPSMFYVLVASLFILLYGYLDEKFDLPWYVQIVLQILVAAMVIIPGTRIEVLQVPTFGKVYLDVWEVFGFPIIEIVGTFLWIVGLMNVVNWLDGVDGLAGGVGVMAGIILALLALQPDIFQTEVVFLGGLVATTYFAFLFFNWNPAKIFMGTYGSMFLGFMLSVIAIYSGGKVATASLVLAFPIIDAIFVIFQRLISGKSIFEADKSHFHHKLLAAGVSPRQVVGIIGSISGFFGLMALLLETRGKILLFFFGFVTMGITTFLLTQKNTKTKITRTSHETIRTKRI